MQRWAGSCLNRVLGSCPPRPTYRRLPLAAVGGWTVRVKSRGRETAKEAAAMFTQEMTTVSVW